MAVPGPADAIELHADPSRGLTVSDPVGRELRLACGAALLNLRLALHGHRIRPLVTLFSDSDRADLLAVVRHGGTKPPTPQQQALLRAVPLRQTNRRPFSDVAVAGPEQHALRRAALEEGAWLHVVDDRPRRARLRELAGAAHRTQMADPAFRAELERWTAAAPDGLAVSFVSQLVEVDRAREELRRLINGTRAPQAVLRIGYGWPVATTPRCAVTDLLIHEAIGTPRTGPPQGRWTLPITTGDARTSSGTTGHEGVVR